MSIATKTGDHGTTSLFYGKRVSKNNIKVAAYGSVDELNSALGICRSHDSDQIHGERILEIQKLNFILSAELATPEEKKDKLKEIINQEHLDILESWVGELEKLPGLTQGWSIPGNDVLSSWYDWARCVCRKSERMIVDLQESEEVNPFILKFINRLSDWLWLMHRKTEINSGN